MFMFNSYVEKMLMLGDFDLNSAQRYTDSVKDVFKQTMLEQEIIFRKQVHELHRLYGIQKTLMRDQPLMKLEKYSLWKANAQPLSQETRHPHHLILMLGSSVSSSNEFIEGCKSSCHKFQQRPFSIELHPDHFTSLDANSLPNIGKVEDHLKETMDVNSLRSGDFSDPPELTLSLSPRLAKRKKKDQPRSWYGKEINTCPRIVIDLEESTERTSEEDAKYSSIDFAANSIKNSGREHNWQVTMTSDPISSRSIKEDLSRQIARSSSYAGDGKCSQYRCNSDQGLKRHEDKPENFLTTKQQFISHGLGLVDLNEVQLDDSSCQSNDAIVIHPLATSSPGGSSGQLSRSQETLCPTTFWNKETKQLSSDSFDTLQQDGVKLALMNSNCKEMRKEIEVRNSNRRNECETTFGTASMSRPLINHLENPGGHGGNTRNRSNELMMKLQNGPTQCLNPASVIAKELCRELTEKVDAGLSSSDKFQIIIEDEHPDKSPVSGKSSCISDDDSSPVTTMQSGIESYNLILPASDQFSGTYGRSQAEETSSGEQDQRSSDSNEIKNKCYNNREKSQVAETSSCKQDQRSSDSNEINHECYNNKEKSAEVDDLIQIAAESLVQISFDNSVCYQESSTQTGLCELENEDKEQPQCSFDTYELMTLKLPESSCEDYSVSSKPIEVSDTERKDFSVKLRRGRRMKDFQRDILPGLSTLSRHEICEDINILEGVLRSREYRKMRAKMANGESWSTPIRSRRSRLNYVGRRSFR